MKHRYKCNIISTSVLKSMTVNDELCHFSCYFTDDNDDDDTNNMRTSFSVGDDDSDYETENVRFDSIHTQTVAVQGLSPLKRLCSLEEPRPLDECVNLMKQDVCGNI